MANLIEEYRDIIKGEVEIINEEITQFNQLHYTAKLNASFFLDRVNLHLISIEQKVGKNSIEYINISTKIVDVICNRLIAYSNLSTMDSIIGKLSASEAVKFYANQRETLEEALRICRRLENMNMDYAYRMKVFNKFKGNLESACREKGVETRAPIQKNIDQLKTIGSVTGEVALETAGCLATLAVKVVIILAIFLILMAIFGVEY
jgi:hypothetical protein